MKSSKFIEEPRLVIGVGTVTVIPANQGANICRMQPFRISCHPYIRLTTYSLKTFSVRVFTLVSFFDPVHSR